MKKLIYILLSAGLCTSCNFLDTEIYDNPDAETIYQDETSCMSGLAGVYDVLGYAGTYGQYLWGDLDSGTDILVYNRSYGKDNLQPNLYTHNNTDGYIKDCWLALYDGINRANDFIDLINQRTDEQCGSARNKKMYIAEARALRALYYMNLVAYWGEVPLRLTPTRDLTTQLLEKSPQEAIYAQIIRDLKAAESGCLPADELNAPGRISRTTVQALLARAYIWQSGYPAYADTWEEARTYAKKVIDSNLHHLYGETDPAHQGYRDLFINMCSNRYDLEARESMFEVEFYGNGMDRSNECGKVGLYIGISQGVTTDPDVPYAYAWYDATKILYRLYLEDGLESDRDAEREYKVNVAKDKGDQRRWWTFADYTYKANAKTGKIEKNYLTDANLTSANNYGRTGNPGKWRAEYDPVRPWARNNSSINFPIMRFADVLLMFAEAENELNGPTDECIKALNRVRERSNARTLLQGEAGRTDNKENMRQLLFREQTRELCFEVPRHMELRRRGEQFYFDRIRMLYDQTAPENPNCGASSATVGYERSDVRSVPAYNISERNLYLPIPQCELSTNTICKQNERW